MQSCKGKISDRSYVVIILAMRTGAKDFRGVVRPLAGGSQARM
jgi:hypothetical protein